MVLEKTSKRKLVRVMSYESLLAELRSVLAKSKVDEVVSKRKGLAEGIEQEGLTSDKAFGVLALFKEMSEAVESDLSNYQTALSAASVEADGLLSDERSASQSRRDEDAKAVAKAHSDKTEELDRVKEAQSELIEEVEKKKVELRTEYEELNWVARKLDQKDFEAKLSAFDDTIKRHEERIEEAGVALVVAENYRDKQMDEVNSAHSKRVAELVRACQKVKDECNEMVQARKATTLRNAKSFLEGTITSKQVARFAGKIEAMRPNYSDFRPLQAESFAKPGDFYLGFARWRTKGDPSSEANAFVRSLNCPYVASSASSSLVGLPYAVNLENGLQILIRPTDSNDAFWDNDCVRALTLRLLMAYPPGKLQLTLIDSFKNGISFSGIPDIADKHHESIISGGVLTEAEFIAQALRSLRAKMGNYSGDQGYGRDKHSYFEREPVQAVVINDFPNGFTPESLADLARLMENGTAFGMLFVIGMNPTFEASFKDNANYRAVIARSEVINLKGNGPGCLSYNDTPFELLISDQDEATAHSEAIIHALHEGVVSSKARAERFAQLFPKESDWQDENAWRRMSSLGGVMIPLGVSGASKITQINVGMPGANTLHHGLIAGPTGAGKSTALHTMIMSMVLNYPPDEVQLVLIDFKEGTEFRSYAPYKIPNFRSITTTTEPEFALAALEDVKSLYEQRASMMTGLLDYRIDNDVSIPQVIVIFDEVQALFTEGVSEDIQKTSLEILTMLVTKGRAMGIHVFLASQNFERVSCVHPLLSDMKIRLCLKDTDTGGIIEDAGALRDAPAGSAILNNQGGAAGKNDLFQVCILDDDERDEVLGKLSGVYAAPEMRDRYRSFNSRLLFTNIEDDFHHPFNAFIETGERPRSDEADPVLRVGSLLKIEGSSFPYRATGRPFDIVLSGENMLLIGDNSSVAKSLFIFSMLSIGLDSLSRRAEFQDEIVLFDFAEGGMYADDGGDELSGDASLKSLYGSFPQLVKHVPTQGGLRRSRRSRSDDEASGKPPVETEIDRLYEELLGRKRECSASEDPDNLAFSRIVLMTFALNSALRLANADSQEGGMYSEMSALAKLQAILDEGPLYDMYAIVWGQTLESTEKILDSNSVKPIGSYFRNRIVFSASDAEFQSLAACVKRPATAEGAAFCNVDRNERVYFRPFDTPKLGWVEGFRERFEDSVGY